MASDNPEKILYLKDSYIKEFKTKIKKISEKDNNSFFAVLSETAFYPNSGGQPYDTGIIKREKDGKEFNVIFVGKFNGEISHEIEFSEGEKLNEGEETIGIIDWDRRYKLMKMHTCAHILSKIIHDETGALITGNQLELDKSRIDFSLEEFDREYLKTLEEKANEVVALGYPIHFEFVSRMEMEKNPDMTKLAKGLPEDLETFRIVVVEGFDRQICGGCHVKNTSEIGKIRIVEFKNKGKSNRRIYFTLEWIPD